LAQLGLQTLKLGHHTHGMTGIDFDKARDLLAVPDRFRIEAAVAIGRAADSAILAEGLRDREVPSDRKPLEEIAFAGWFVSEWPLTPDLSGSGLRQRAAEAARPPHIA